MRGAGVDLYQGVLLLQVHNHAARTLLNLSATEVPIVSDLDGIDNQLDNAE